VKGSYNFVISKVRATPTLTEAGAGGAAAVGAGLRSTEDSVEALRRDLDAMRAAAKRDRVLYMALGAAGAGLGLLGLLAAICTAIGTRLAIRRSRFDRVPPIRAISKTYEDGSF
jgi:hypothetical protein